MAVLMFKPTLPLWMHSPELRFVQFPWRWLLCLNVPVAIGFALAVRRWWSRALICAVAVSIVLIGWHAVQAPWWDSADDVQEMVDNQNDGIGNEGIDEYVPAGVDPYEVDKKAPLAKGHGNAGNAQISALDWRAESKSLAVKSDSAGIVVLRLFNYPLWHATVNGAEVRTESTETTGQMSVPIEAGNSQIRITFQMGSDRKLGIALSLAGLFVLVLLFTITRRLRLSPA